jgi:hypothetical protein
MKPPFAELNLDSALRFDPPPEGPPAETSLALLQAVYRDPAMPLQTRMRAATVAIAYEHPKLSVAVTTNHHGMGKAIDHARAKLEAKRLPPAVDPAPVQSAQGGASFRRIVPAMSGDEATRPRPLAQAGTEAVVPCATLALTVRFTVAGRRASPCGKLNHFRAAPNGTVRRSLFLRTVVGFDIGARAKPGGGAKISSRNAAQWCSRQKL